MNELSSEELQWNTQAVAVAASVSGTPTCLAALAKAMRRLLTS